MQAFQFTHRGHTVIIPDPQHSFRYYIDGAYHCAVYNATLEALERINALVAEVELKAEGK